MQKHQPNRRAFLRTSICAGGFVFAAPLPGLITAMASDDLATFLDAVRAGQITTVRDMLAAEPDLLNASDDRGVSAYAIALLHRHLPIAELFRQHGYKPDLHEAALALDWQLFSERAEQSPDQVNVHHPIGGTAMYCAAAGGAGTDMWRVYSACGRPDARSADHATPLRAALEFHDRSVAELTAATLLGNGADPNLPQPGGQSPLHIAAARGSVELVEMLIRKHAAVQARNADGHTPADLAERAGRRAVVELLSQHEQIPRDFDDGRRAVNALGEPYDPPDISDLPAQQRSAIVGRAHTDLNAVREALQQEPRLVHAEATTGEAAVEAGAHMGRTDIVDLLLEHGAPYALTTAIMRNDLPSVRRMIAAEPRRIHERGPHDFALLWYPAIGGGLIELLQVLLDAGANIEQQHHLGTTALHFAVMRGQIDVVRLLIEHGADVNRAGRKFGGRPMTPLAMARRGEFDRIVTMLQQHGARD